MNVAVFYATQEGHTRRIANRIALDLRGRHVNADIYDVKDLREPFDWSSFDTAFVAASVHVGHHEREMVAFVRKYRGELERCSAVFVSVTLSQAGAELADATPDRRRLASADAQRMIDVFIEDTGWRPAHVLPVAGALAYSQYNFLIRIVMKLIARKAGFSGDASHDYEFTNWPALDRFVGNVARSAEQRVNT